jgi:integrase/recombinase XerD
MVNRQNVRGNVYKLPEYLEPHQVDILIRYAADASMVSANLLLTMWRAGLRVSEACALNANDLKFEFKKGETQKGAQIHVRGGKGDRDRYVPAHPELQDALTSHIRYLKIRGNNPVFIGPRAGQRISRITGYQYVQGAYARAMRDGALPHGLKITPHVFRHSAARHWLMQGVPIHVVSLWLGHAQLKTTLIYTQLSSDIGNLMQEVA